ncbi:MAG: dihydropteroate synthase [Bacteroidota bacterium]
MFTLNCKGRLLIINEPIVMGILNITPDSFYEDSRVNTTDAIITKAGQMIADGATIIDVGGQSTRPNSQLLAAYEETERVIPAIIALAKAYPTVFISIDTFYASTAAAAVAAGASLVNDVSGGSMDAAMLSTVARLNVPYVCMHTKGNPQNMQAMAQYKNITVEVLDYFINQLQQCKAAGITDVLIDPGFGFAKDATHNFQLLRNLAVFKQLGCPILAGLSRKSSIYKTLGITAAEALNGTTVVNTLALQNGAAVLRVHDVKEAAEAIKLYQLYKMV